MSDDFNCIHSKHKSNNIQNQFFNQKNKKNKEVMENKMKNSHEQKCNHHKKSKKHVNTVSIQQNVQTRLILVCLVCSIFILTEFLGGLFSGSIAIMTDAAHLVSDLAGFVISIIAIQISKKSPDNHFTFGYHRAEVIGALVSMILIWILMFLLLVESISRFFNSSHVIDSSMMLFISSLGLVFNIILAYILHSDDGHHHHHSSHHDNKITALLGHNDLLNNISFKSKILRENINGPFSRSFEENNFEKDYFKDNITAKPNIRSILTKNFDENSKIDEDFGLKKFRRQSPTYFIPIESLNEPLNQEKAHKHAKESHCLKENVNMKAAMVHIIGDIIQSIGVIIAALIIYVFPNLQFIDPLTTVLFSFIVGYTTIPIIKDCFHIMMEGVPKNINIQNIKNDILAIQDITKVISLHIWSISQDKLSINVKVISSYPERLKEIRNYFYKNFNVFTLNVEIHKNNEYLNEI